MLGFQHVGSILDVAELMQVYATSVSRTGGLLVRAAELGVEVERYKNHIVQTRTCELAIAMYLS